MTTTGAGRPRLRTRTRPGATARDEILDAAAELFTTRGFTGTSTRMIADAVGIRQASMYHHFSTKDDILAALLLGTVAGPVEQAGRIRAHCGDPVVRVYALALFDAGQLAGSRWNLGALYLLPEVTTDRFAEFRSLRDRLMATYTAFARDALAAIGGRDCGPGTADLPFRLVEATISARSDAAAHRTGSAVTPHTVATAALRTLGWDGPVDAVSAAADALLAGLAESCPQADD
ncbi:TetR/AcrR family transcriptional regulator [Rhodococcus sp. SGAir0479]|uniref:TetR/AcrR family transcriptional regulator n=1 Tax=Rhodococcus sp. SGAir0479 TaxID=2567884 RepID=UPI0010CD5265|nr:TetR/AcrR family transcriptional regulator [Rhodococcus sp. SGAir0479]QCQ90901.1 TetR/AcrR family transcriptional regulator [Rhodococcus sp. SGAir0479]